MAQYGYWGCSSVVERPLRMREASGSIPDISIIFLKSVQLLCSKAKGYGLVRDLNPGPRAPEARIIPLDQRATFVEATFSKLFNRGLSGSTKTKLVSHLSWLTWQVNLVHCFGQSSIWFNPCWMMGGFFEWDWQSSVDF